MEIKKLQENQRRNISIRCKVGIIQKHYQKTEDLTANVVKRILANSWTHPHGIKVQLKSGEVGLVKKIWN